MPRTNKATKAKADSSHDANDATTTGDAMTTTDANDATTTATTDRKATLNLIRPRHKQVLDIS